MLFTRFFYKHLTGREFIVSSPVSRESHHITITKAFTKLFYEQRPAYGLLINLPPGYGKPLCKESTLLLTKDGARKKLGDICVGDQVLTHKGRFKKVMKLFNQGSLPVLKIKTFCGREIISAYDHTFLTAKGWIKANELKIDDVLATTVPILDFGMEVRPEKARLLGYFIGDGCISGNSANITACDLLSINDITKCVEELGFSWSFQKYQRKNTKDHHSKTLERINVKHGIRDWLINEGIANKNSYTKRVPESIMRANFEGIRNFLGAYFACDGTFGHKGQGRRDFSASITSVSRELLEDCQHLFCRLGIRTRIRKKIRNQKTKIQGDTYTSYNLEFTSQDDMYNFQKQIGKYIYHNKANLMRSHDFKRIRFDSDLLPDHIVSIEENGFAECMCIEVEEDHTFTANDIVVHNSVMTSMWIAWCYAHYPDCNFLYISYSHELAAAHTAFIKQIMSTNLYKYLFDVHISSETRAKDHFATTAGGMTAAFGSGGAVTGRNAGNSGLKRFSGCAVLDDAHKPSEVHSDSIRETVIRNYNETIIQRPRDVNVPIVFIGQRLHEDDLAAYMLSGKDVRKWESIVLKGIDDAGNALYPEVQPLSYLKELEKKQPFVFCSQIQQNPIPSGGALFKPDWFIILDETPEILATFITADTAETDKSYNDATAFSFWGLYVINTFSNNNTLYGLHWLDSVELRIEPRELEAEFYSFYSDCMLFSVKPKFAAIEQKSTGVTLISTLKDMRGLQIKEVKRTKASGSKTQRFLEMQPIIASKQISFTKNARHVDMCINHMIKITANNAHKHDDLADNCYDAIKIALIDKLVINQVEQTDYSALAKNLTSLHNKQNRSRQKAYSK